MLNPGTIQITYSNAGGFQANQKINGLMLSLRPVLSGAGGRWQRGRCLDLRQQRGPDLRA